MTNTPKQPHTEQPTRTGASGGTSAHVEAAKPIETKPAEESRLTHVESLAEQALATAQAKTPTSSPPGIHTERKEQKFVPSVNRWVQFGCPKKEVEPVLEIKGEDGEPAIDTLDGSKTKDSGEFYVDAALITAVNEDGTVELTVFPAKGSHRDVKKSLSVTYFVENAVFAKKPTAGCYFQAPYVPQG